MLSNYQNLINSSDRSESSHTAIVTNVSHREEFGETSGIGTCTAKETLWWQEDTHDSDRMAVLVMVSKAECIVLFFILYICILDKIKISFLPSFLLGKQWP